MLLPWVPVFQKGAMDAFLSKHILPKLEQAVARWEINPSRQELGTSFFFIVHLHATTNVYRRRCLELGDELEGPDAALQHGPSAGGPLLPSVAPGARRLAEPHAELRGDRRLVHRLEGSLSARDRQRPPNSGAVHASARPDEPLAGGRRPRLCASPRERATAARHGAAADGTPGERPSRVPRARRVPLRPARHPVRAPRESFPGRPARVSHRQPALLLRRPGTFLSPFAHAEYCLTCREASITS